MSVNARAWFESLEACVLDYHALAHEDIAGRSALLDQMHYLMKQAEASFKAGAFDLADRGWLVATHKRLTQQYVVIVAELELLDARARGRPRNKA